MAKCNAEDGVSPFHHRCWEPQGHDGGPHICACDHRWGWVEAAPPKPEQCPDRMDDPALPGMLTHRCGLNVGHVDDHACQKTGCVFKWKVTRTPLADEAGRVGTIVMVHTCPNCGSEDREEMSVSIAYTGAGTVVTGGGNG